MRTEPYCGDCPDRETCTIGASCDFTRSAARMFNQLDAILTGKGRNTMSKNITPADVAAQAAEEKLVTTVPAQDKVKGEEKAAEQPTVETPDDIEDTDETGKKTVKDRFKALADAAKNNKQFFYGVVVGAVAASITVAKLAKEKVEEVVELTVLDETDGEDTSTDESGV